MKGAKGSRIATTTNILQNIRVNVSVQIVNYFQKVFLFSSPLTLHARLENGFIDKLNLRDIHCINFPNQYLNRMREEKKRERESSAETTTK